MLYYLSQFESVISELRLFQYITVRTLCAAATGFIIMLVISPSWIHRLRAVNFSEQKVDERVGVERKGQKLGTPTMGGIIIIIATTFSTLFWAIPTNRYVLLTLGTLITMGAIGFLDDYWKIKRKNGLSVRGKFLAQLFWAIVVFLVLWSDSETQQRVRDFMVPFYKHPLFDLGLVGGWIFIVVVLVGTSNAVNLTDGLDGLAIGCSNSVIGAYLLLTYVAGHFNFSQYLQVPFVQGSGELTVFCGALLGAGLGFLWFNCHPAKIFMGDTGSLSIGAAVGMLAILIKQELLLVIVGGVFVIEALSVIVQTTYFKYTRKRFGEGRRIFKCAPLHHHFEHLEKERAVKANRLPELIETVIVTRFWILGIIFALVGIATLKIR
tara:strand:+ start:153 stop:1292 length:1140 start_codon:yes stop_codon:yes gene_type:complete